VSVGNLITEDAELIVNPANRYLKHEAGAAKVIATAAGPALMAECTEFIQAYETLPIAHVTHTSARNLPGSIRYVIHTVAPDVKEIPDLMQCLELLKATFLNCLVYANDVLCAKSSCILAPPGIVATRRTDEYTGCPQNFVHYTSFVYTKQFRNLAFNSSRHCIRSGISLTSCPTVCITYLIDPGKFPAEVWVT